MKRNQAGQLDLPEGELVAVNIEEVDFTDEEQLRAFQAKQEHNQAIFSRRHFQGLDEAGV